MCEELVALVLVADLIQFATVKDIGYKAIILRGS